MGRSFDGSKVNGAWWWMGREAGVGEWTGWVDGWGDHWIDGRMARRKVEWGGKAGVCVSGPDGWMGRPLDGRADGPTES